MTKENEISRWNSCSSSIFQSALFCPRNNPTSEKLDTRLESRTFKYSNNLALGEKKGEEEEKINFSVQVKSRGDEKGGDLSRRDVEKLARNRAMSPICCEITSEGGGEVDNGESVNWTDGGEKRKRGGKGSILLLGSRVSLFPLSFLSLFFLLMFLLSS